MIHTNAATSINSEVQIYFGCSLYKVFIILIYSFCVCICKQMELEYCGTLIG